MARFFGKIGFSVMKETAPGVYTETIVERNYYGNVVRDTARWQGSENLNDDRVISNSISVVSDPYANNNCDCMRYLVWMGTKWKINSIEVQRPRLLLNLGGVYNGITGPASSDP